MNRNNKYWTAMATWIAFAIAGCGGGGGGGGGAVVKKKEPPTKTFNYTISDSAGYFQVGRRAVVLHRGLNGDCLTATAYATNVLHSVDAAVVSPGIVNLSFTISFEKGYLETIYIDMNGNNFLDNGDMVWGTDPLDLAAACINKMEDFTANQTFDWTSDVAAFIGSTVWQGGAQPFGAGEESGIRMSQEFQLGPEGY